MTMRGYRGVWAGVMALALASLLLPMLKLSAAAPAVALGIGVVKAVLIALFCMHVIEQPSISRWAFVLGLSLAALLLIMVGLDVITRDTPPLRQPGMVAAADAPPAAR